MQEGPALLSSRTLPNQSATARLAPRRTRRRAICGRLQELGVIVQPTGPGANVLKLKPPLCITRHDIDFFAGALEHTLSTGW